MDVEEFTPADGVAGDRFGNSVALSGDAVVVGAPLKDDGGEEAGAAYVFRVRSGDVEEIVKLTAADTLAMGNSVAISDDTVAVGVGQSGDFLGSVYVYERDQGGPGNWGQVAELTASDGEEGDGFGWSVWIDQDTVVVGAPWWDDIDAIDSGAAYVFERDQGGPDNWGEVARLTVSDPADDVMVGNSVAISGDTILAGAYCLFGSCVEAAYVFERDQGGLDNWGEAKKLIPSDSDPSERDRFGIFVSLSADTAVVGADTDLCDPAVSGPRCGSAFVFERDLGGTNEWGEAIKLTASDASDGHGFGVSVSVSGDLMVIGAWQNADGSAYLFQRDPEDANSWEEIEELVGSNVNAPERFGVDVAIDREKVVVGAQGPSGSPHEIGAAYWFRFLQLIFADGFESGDTSAWTTP